jgi:hypothetical protein
MFGTPRARQRSVFRLAAFLRLDAGEGPGRVHERDDGHVESVGELHEADRLAIALRPRHAEIVPDPRLGVRPFFLAEDANRAAAEPAEAADDRGILAEQAVARQRREVRDQRLHVVAEVRPLRMARDLRLLPRREAGIEIGERLLRLGFEARQFLADRDRVPLRCDVPQLLDLRFELGDGLFEVEVATHLCRAGLGGGSGYREDGSSTSFDRSLLESYARGIARSEKRLPCRWLRLPPLSRTRSRPGNRLWTVEGPRRSSFPF